MAAITEQILQYVSELPHEMQEETLDFVQFLQTQLIKKQALSIDKNESNRQAIADVLNRMAERGTAFSQIEEPVEWQREIRSNRFLPGRDE